MIELTLKADTAPQLVNMLANLHEAMSQQPAVDPRQGKLQLAPVPATVDKPNKPAKQEKAPDPVPAETEKAVEKSAAEGVISYETLKQLAAKLLVNPATKKDATKIVRAAAGSNALTDVPEAKYSDVFAQLQKLEASLAVTA